ncbi:MAG: tRNA pseudouridine(38-40) synthase TruA [Actinomycetota bacterium]
MKIALQFAYDGTDFHGFARQKQSRTIQGALEDRLTTLLRTPVTTVGAGRTDAGVHAAAQAVSFDAPDATDPSWLKHRLNKWLAPAIVVRAAAEVPESFSARFSAARRAYEYRIYRSESPDPFRDRFAVWMPDRLNLTKMRAGARALIGEHDFSSFCRKGPEGSSTVRTVIRSQWIDEGDGVLRYEIRANAFCWQMVRSIVGTLVDVGIGRLRPGDMLAILRACDRDAAGPVAPPRGLCLWEVGY